MLANQELMLLIKSRYPLIVVESPDEPYVVNQLKQIADGLRFAFYEWSVTEGLEQGGRSPSFAQTFDPEKMLRTILGLYNPEQPELVPLGSQQPPSGQGATRARARQMEAGLFVLKDFDKHLENPIHLRLFKDLIHLFRNSRNTVVMVSPEYKLPKDVEIDAGHIIGGYPDEREIAAIVKDTWNELVRYDKRMKISLAPEEIPRVLRMLKGLSTQQIRNVLNECFIDDCLLDIKDLNKIEIYKKKLFDQEGLLEFCLTESMGNVANFNNLRGWLAERKVSFAQENPALPTPKGILLMGVQGCGKSLAVKAIAQQLNLPLYRLDMGKLYGQYVGQTEQNLRKALGIIDKLSPVCLWMDEIEKGFAASMGDSDGGVSQRVLGTFLTWMQERKSTCFIAATANIVERLPPEFLRKGRFDEIFFVDLPTPEDRKTLFTIHLKKRNCDPARFDCGLLAKEAVDFSGSEIEQAVISALYRASGKNEAMGTNHVLGQIRSTKPLAVMRKEEITRLRNWAKERTIPA